MAFADHFSHDSKGYASFRTDYPDAIFDDLASRAPATGLAWDCATGTGQAAVALAERFDRVIATDGSAAQIEAAKPHPRVEYRVADAVESGLPARSVDLVTVAQALHWFAIDRFWREVGRVTVPGGLFAAWTYGLLRLGPDLDPIVDRLYRDVVGPWWPPERRHVEDGYRSIAIPFAEERAPDWSFDRTTTFDGLIGYLGTWSAVKRYRDETADDPIPPIASELRAAWGDPGRSRTARIPVAARLARIP